MKKYLVGAALLLAGLMGMFTVTATAAPVATWTKASLFDVQAAPSQVEKAQWFPRRYYGGPPRVVFVRPWYRRPHYGVLVGGIALGALLAGSYYYSHPYPPGPGLCWYWTSPSRVRGYWDYCE
jgi:hypothetical protein